MIYRNKPDDNSAASIAATCGDGGLVFNVAPRQLIEAACKKSKCHYLKVEFIFTNKPKARLVNLPLGCSGPVKM